MAKSDVGTITVYLEAQAQQFDAKMKAAGKSVGKFQATVKAATGKMSVAWASLQAKISLVTGVVEAGFRSATAVMKIFSGDIETAYEGLRKLPLGIGALVDSMNDLIMAIPAVSAAFVRQSSILEKHHRDLEKLTARVAKTRAALAKMGDFTNTPGDGYRRLQQLSMSERGESLEFDRSEEKRKLINQYNKAAGDLDRMAMRGEISQAAARKAMSEALEVSDRRMEYINKYYDRLAATADLEKKVAAIQGQAADNLSGLHNAMNHELHLLAVRGAEEAEIADMRLRKHKAITDALEDQRAALERAGASESTVADAAKQIVEHATSGIQDLEIRLESLLAKQREMKAQGPDVTSMSFSTAVGSIVLPDRKQANVTRREQLIAARKTNELIAKTNDRLMALGTTMP